MTWRPWGLLLLKKRLHCMRWENPGLVPVRPTSNILNSISSRNGISDFSEISIYESRDSLFINLGRIVRDKGCVILFICSNVFTRGNENMESYHNIPNSTDTGDSDFEPYISTPYSNLLDNRVPTRLNWQPAFLTSPGHRLSTRPLFLVLSIEREYRAMKRKLSEHSQDMT